MTKLITAKCPNCGAILNISEGEERIKCEYCNNTIIVEDAIACYKLKVEGTISIDGIESNTDLINSANELIEMKEYLKAKKKFLEFSEKCPDNYQGWLGLLICRTRNFTIKDNNIMFENDVNNYYEHFNKTAPEEVKAQYSGIMNNYLYPDKLETKVKNITENVKDFKINPKIKPFIMPSLLILSGVSMIINSIFIGGLLFILAGIILIPQAREKINISKKRSIIISVILSVVGFIAFSIECPYGFVGKWQVLNDTALIELKKDNTFTIQDSSGIINGTYTYEYKGGEYYIITLSTNNENYNNIQYKYNSNAYRKLCLYENESCSVYYEQTKNQ